MLEGYDAHGASSTSHVRLVESMKQACSELAEHESAPMLQAERPRKHPFMNATAVPWSAELWKIRLLAAF